MGERTSHQSPTCFAIVCPGLRNLSGKNNLVENFTRVEYFCEKKVKVKKIVIFVTHKNKCPQQLALLTRPRCFIVFLFVLFICWIRRFLAFFYLLLSWRMCVISFLRFSCVCNVISQMVCHRHCWTGSKLKSTNFCLQSHILKSMLHDY